MSMAAKKSGANLAKGKCSDCGRGVVDKDFGIQCEVCDEWFHCKCIGMSDDFYQCLIDNAGCEGISWFCKGCKKGVGKICKEQVKINARLDKMDNEVKTLRSEMDEVKDCLLKVKSLAVETDNKLDTAVGSKLIEEVDKVRQETKDLIATVGVQIDKNVGVKIAQGVEDTVKVMSDDVREAMEIEKRKNNVVIFGVKEDDLETDEDKIKYLLSKINFTHTEQVVEVIRVGKKVDKGCRPIRVKLSTFEGKGEVIRKAKLLRDSDNENLKRTFISPDLTRKQQEKDKVLRDKLKTIRESGEKEAKIKSGKVVKNGTAGGIIVLFSPQ